ncbi:MAG: carotenoid biosynthesis protein [Cytophagales bacterium]|nr:MAG: carotenoid biosynthesis protein [Cytophagales bacterium]
MLTTTKEPTIYGIKIWPIAVYLTVAMHFFGLLFMNFSFSRELFERLTPVNLLFSALFLGIFQTHKVQKFWLFSVLVAFLGYAAELLGVHTGLVFGHYWYDNNLGYKLWAVPPLIGLNWWTLTVASNSFWREYVSQKWLLAILSALTMTFMDYLIEPFAMQRGLWSWQNDSVPFQNYVAWFGFSFLFSCLYLWLVDEEASNKFSKILLACMLAFFGLMLLF